jgi:hypothetical protein
VVDLANLSADELVALQDRIAAELVARDTCEHGTVCGDWCPKCNRDYNRALRENWTSVDDAMEQRGTHDRP